MSLLGEFGKTAQSLARNPLGIIALFIVLLYGIAGLVLGTSAKNMEPSERLPLIWFLAIFPVIVLGVFSWLVSRHHQKLYAPSDFKSDDAFLQTISPESQRQRLEKEVAELAPSTDGMQDTQLPSREAAKNVAENVNRIRADVVLAEDLVLRQIEADYNAPVRRNQAMALSDSQKILLDGVLLSGGKLYAIEVKLFRESTVRKNLHNRLAEIAYLANRLAALNATNLSLLFAVVSADLTEETRHLIERQFTSMVKGAAVPIDLKFFDFMELKERYGVVDSA
jgi:hypothetical protein